MRILCHIRIVALAQCSGGSRELASLACPRHKRITIACRSIAHAIACRTRCPSTPRLHVEVHVNNHRTRPRLGYQVRRIAQRMHHVQRDRIALKIARALLQLQRCRNRIRHHRKSYLRRASRRTGPVVRISLDDTSLSCTALTNETARPHRMQSKLSSRTLRHHAKQPIAHVEQQPRIRMLQMHHDRQPVPRLRVIDSGKTPTLRRDQSP
jgi:hypothetical protein